jgi:hypothetical protein
VLDSLRVQLYMGAIVPAPAPRELVEALESVQVNESADGQSGFQLAFNAALTGRIQREWLPSGFFDAPRRVVISVWTGGAEQVLIDGVITRHELTASNEPGKTRLTVTGTDLSQVMDLIDFSGFPWPALPPEARVLAMIAKYAPYGVVPLVLPSVMLSVRNPLEGIDQQSGTDLAYIRQLAQYVGYTFQIRPGPAVGLSTAYWGPAVKIGELQPALTVNMDSASNVESLTLGFDGIGKKVFVFFIQEPNSRAPIPIPLPDITPLSPPLGLKPPLPLGFERIDYRLSDDEDVDRTTAKLDAVAAALRGLARATAAADVVNGSGNLKVARYGHVLRPRALVGVRGAGPTYDGHYFVKSVSHSIRPGDYAQSFQLSRNALVAATSELPV